jgi:hypothetical protein
VLGPIIFITVCFFIAQRAKKRKAAYKWFMKDSRINHGSLNQLNKSTSNIVQDKKDATLVIVGKDQSHSRFQTR